MEKRNLFKNDNKIDYGVILPVFLLCLVGLASLYVASYHDPLSNSSPWNDVFQQLLWYVVGVVAVIIIMHIKPRQLWTITKYAYAAGLAVMALLVQFYDEDMQRATGSKNWFSLGPITVQPAELMKIAMILMLAMVVTKHNASYQQRTLKSDGILIGKMLAVVAPVLFLIMLQDDFGSMLVFLAIFGGIFLMSGISWRIIIPVIVVFLVISVGTIALVVSDGGREFLSDIGLFSQYQFARIDSWLDPFHDVQGDSMQVASAMMAIGSGGLFGKGFNTSEIAVQVRESDMIFSVIGENFGFVGSAFVVLLYFILIYRMIRVCFDTNNEFYSYLATGIIMMILFHVFENIGANIGLLPLTGIPLPFISQGGSALLSNMVGVGLILAMRYQATNEA
ncbi:MAG: FtsW/RodA/SpoVE family cell cycle protein [Tetragenococcus halophilus]|uniref:FtsW/RodA/SpoVE family cell cycle protein n=1 Tax=Tetragenococcus halophilus TaxID=51669 RepID=A0A3G5FGI4_TETHA|nr:FtsW/RodA/SpoVE family cell cycle protein [Tetragenococcus halophilus]AYW49453.1 FtsW/RodA/SpoVE family cell cycle protein [Tetragenococcus halophilus]MCF1601808.1 FtsW/RodA/SpoVE family cell cycle protein [Tetragenococcus halophilus]MCF1675764.1 FtsW/RodA/SpoVE family cell cycle protein [Tetragenococcus halophilus]MCT8310521.1 FtsW/RodA/SpoVE family cell cycle protein [Tetragenococcus halophilus]MDN5831363.1 FtsW/RodA/SpoVE family cell cycle protein [Tetragenococcus halophilus]